MKEEIKQRLIELYELSIELKDFNPQESKAILYVIKELNIIINKYEQLTTINHLNTFIRRVYTNKTNID